MWEFFGHCVYMFVWLWSAVLALMSVSFISISHHRVDCRCDFFPFRDLDFCFLQLLRTAFYWEDSAQQILTILPSTVHRLNCSLNFYSHSLFLFTHIGRVLRPIEGV